MTIENKYKLGEIVFLITDPDQYQRIITAIQININGSIIYHLAQGINETWHFEVEIASDKNFSI